MKSAIHVPDLPRSAGRQIRRALAAPLECAPNANCVRAWCSVAYLFPGLHPDGFEDADRGWPRILKHFAAEAWHPSEIGEIADEELDPSDSQWSGLYDRMRTLGLEEAERRMELATSFAQSADA